MRVGAQPRGVAGVSRMTMKYKRILLLLAVPAALMAQMDAPPVLNPRGAKNDVSRQPAPTMVSPGSHLRLSGLNLGPIEPVTPKTFPLPTEVGNPATQVLINNQPAPIVSASPDAIVCQVPWDIAPGAAVAVVRRGEQSSRAVRFNIRPLAPAIRSAEGTGFGAAGGVQGTSLDLRATGLGVTEPAQTSGMPAETEAKAVQPVLVFADGLPVAAAVKASEKMPGEFAIQGELPKEAEAGDLLQVVVQGNAAPQLPANPIRKTQVASLPLPGELAELRVLQGSDLRGGMGALIGPRGDDGCYPVWSFDVRRGSMKREEGCLTASNRAALTPVQQFPNSPAMASFIGPGDTSGQLPAYTKLRLWHPSLNGSQDLELPFPVNNLNVGGDGDLRAVAVATGQILKIDPETGGVEGAEPLPVNPNPGGGVAANLLRTGELDLGDGVKKVLAAIQVQGGVAVVVGDNDTKPSKAKVAVVDFQGQVAGTRDYVEGWLPLAAPAPPARPGQTPAQPALRLPVTAYLDAATRILYVASISADGQKHAMAGFGPEGQTRVVPTPEGWFFAACSADVRVFDLELTRRIAFFGSRTLETQFRQPCTARGFLEMSLGANPSMRAFELAGNGQFNVTAGANELNDFLYGVDSDPTQAALANAIFLFDSATESSLRLDSPSGVLGFGVGSLRPAPALNMVMALGQNRRVGDAGIVAFDLESGEARLLPTPEGFEQVQILDIFTSTRKLLARGIVNGAGGSQYLVYDLVTGDLEIVPNPSGVAFAGPPAAATPGQPVQPGQPGQPGQQAQPAAQVQRINTKANAVLAVGYDAERKPVSLLYFRIP